MNPRPWPALAMAVALVVATATGARADPPAFDAGTLPTVDNFAPITLNGTPQLTTATISPFLVVDNSGALSGWNVTLLLPDFHNGSGSDCTIGSTATLPASGVSMDAPVVAPANGTTSMSGVSAAGFTDFTSARKIVVAAAGSGDGTYSVSPGLLKLVVPPTVAAASYCTQATIAIATGP